MNPTHITIRTTVTISEIDGSTETHEKQRVLQLRELMPRVNSGPSPAFHETRLKTQAGVIQKTAMLKMAEMLKKEAREL